MEVRYEDLIEEPLAVIKHIYERLRLPGFDNVERKLEEYIASQRTVKTHRYDIDSELKEKIYRYFHMMIDRWGYDV